MPEWTTERTTERTTRVRTPAPRPDPVTQVRTAVRRFLARHRPVAVAVACSGGADSLALAEATVHCAGRMGLAVHGLVVDHQLQPDSSRVAQATVSTLRQLGCAEARVLPVTVRGPGGLEAAARRARYAALRAGAPPHAVVLLGHTLDDQAETVLLGLSRGSGPRSVAGMREFDPPWGRPLLAVRRAVTAAACAALDLTPWHDPHNSDRRFRRVRLRAEVLPLLEEVCAGGVAEALARTAAQLREDLEVLDAQAAELHERALRREAPGTPAIPGASGIPGTLGTATAHLDVETLRTAPAALRRRVLRCWLLAAGVPALTDTQLRAVDDLVGNWSGQGAVRLAGDTEVSRTHGRLRITAAAPLG